MNNDCYMIYSHILTLLHKTLVLNCIVFYVYLGLVYHLISSDVTRYLYYELYY